MTTHEFSISANSGYRGRLAPTPSGYLHLGHALTLATAFDRAQQVGGTLVLRIEDLDRARCQSKYAEAQLADLRWLNLDWAEGPDVSGPYAPYTQSARMDVYRQAWAGLAARGAIYPSPHSRQDVEQALQAPHEEEPIFPPELRPLLGTGHGAREPGAMNWRFRVPDGRAIVFHDQNFGEISRVAGTDFGDFLVWRKDGWPSYELAVVADDHAMAISEVVRGEDLLTSTARQLLLYEHLGWLPPAFYHCPLVRDAAGRRLAKRTAGLEIRSLREAGYSPSQVRAEARARLTAVRR